MTRRILLYGAGSVGSRLLDNIHAGDIVVACLDAAPEKQGGELRGVRIMHPRDVSGLAYDFIVIASMYFYEIAPNLVALGVDHGCIVSVEDYRENPFYLNGAPIMTRLEKRALGWIYDVGIGSLSRCLRRLGILPSILPFKESTWQEFSRR